MARSDRRRLGAAARALVIPLLVVALRDACAQDLVFAHMEYHLNRDLIMLDSGTAAFPGRFMLDTGSSYLVFDARFAGSLVANGRAERVITPMGVAPFALYQPPELRFGKWTVARTGHAATCSMEVFNKCVDVGDLGGMIGVCGMAACTVAIDYDADTLTIGDGEPTIPYLSLYVTAPLLPDAGARPWISLSIAGKAGVFLLDTGSDGALSLEAGWYDALARSGAIRTVALGQQATALGEGQQTLGLVTGVSCASHPYPALEADRGLPRQQGGYNAVGVKFLRRHAVVIDLRRRLLYLRHRPGWASRPDTVNASGLHIWIDHGCKAVTTIDPGSPAAACGIVAGDVLVAMDGVPAQSLHLVDIAEALAGFADHPVHLRFRSAAGAAEKDVVLAPAAAHG